jgi:hypothetical protein
VELERFLAPLTATGVDMFHCSTRRFWSRSSSLALLVTAVFWMVVGTRGPDLVYTSDDL